MLALGKFVYQHFFRTIDKAEIERQFDETFEWAQVNMLYEFEFRILNRRLQTLEEEYNKEHCIEIDVDNITDEQNEKCTKRNGMYYANRCKDLLIS